MQSGHSHSEFGPPAYRPTFSYGVVQTNSTHDMNKQVQAAPQNMFAASQAIPPGVQQHHQSGMGGPPAAQHPNFVQQAQLNRGSMSNVNTRYYATAPQRTMQNMSRAPINNAVNHTGQPPSQYNIVPQQQSFMQPVIVQQVYQQRQYAQSHQYQVMSPVTYMNSPYQSFGNTGAPPPNPNNYFNPTNCLPYQSVQPPPQAVQPQNRKKSSALAIIDPDTGKSIFDDNGTSPQPEKTIEVTNVIAQFATQVAATLDNKNDSSKSSSIEDTRIVDKQPISPSENESEMSETVCEQYSDVRNMTCNDKQPILPQRNELEFSNVNSPDVYDKPEHIEVEDFNVVPDSIVNNYAEKTTEEEPLQYYAVQETRIAISDLLALSHEQNSSEPVVDEVLSPNEELPESISPSVSTLKLQDKVPPAESKKNKTKKKKDLNKKGENKEGGEMDAFLDKEEEVVPAASISPPLSPAAPVPEVLENPPSPVTILDRDILNSIPLPDDPPPINIEQSDSPSEVVSDNSCASPAAETEDKENIEDTISKSALKYNYKEDQWSPLNPEGKKQYDREFLLQMQDAPYTLRKPNNLPKIEVVRDKAHIQRLTEVNRPMLTAVPVRSFDPFCPGYLKGGPPRPPHPPVNRRSQQGRDKPKKVISFSSSLNQAVKLHESENAWKPTHKTENPVEDNPETEELYKKVRGILNKLTPQKFSTLVEQVKNLDIDTEVKLNGVIDLVFEKAIDEPNFSVPYANMCKNLALIKVPSGQANQLVNFRKILLTKCQKEFERDRSEGLKCQERMQSIRSADSDERRKELQLEFDEEEKKLRYRQLGNIRFIGELFKLHILTEPIMQECIEKLLHQKDEETLECLCRLLKTIGKELGESRKSGFLDRCFGQLQDIVQQRVTSSRVRFMLQDVIELRKNNWVPRRDENNPKTIDQIHKDAEREAHEQQQSLQSIPYVKRPPDDRRKPRSADDGWTPTSKSNKGTYNSVDPNKLKLTKPSEMDNIRLGPGGRGSWSRGSSGGSKTDAETKPNLLGGNRYQALAENNYEARRGSQRSAASSRESSRGAVRKPKSELSEEEMQKRTKPLVEELLQKGDIEEAVKGVAELGSPAHLFVSAAVNQVLERSSQSRFVLGQLLGTLVRRSLLFLPEAAKGFKAILDYASDYELDIPRFWDYLGEILEPMLDDVKLAFLRGMPAKLLAAVLRCAAAKRGGAEVADLWKDSGLQWADFLVTDATHFIQTNKLDFLISPIVVEPKSQLSMEEVKKQLGIFLKSNEKEEVIVDWINSQLVPERVFEPSFIRAFVIAIYENAITGSGNACELDNRKIKGWIPWLTRFINHNTKLEVQTLYAIQALMNRLCQPKGMMNQIFEELYDNELISEDSFRAWYKSKDPSEQEGRGVAVLSVHPFFLWLNEDENEANNESGEEYVEVDSCT